MKDFVPKGTGNSRYLKSVSNFLAQYPDYNSFAQALIAGTLPIDLNGINANGVQQAGTALSKANLLTDATATALGLAQSDPTVNDALYAISQKEFPAECHVYADAGTSVTMKKGAKTLSATAGSNKQAILYPAELGTWSVTRTWKGTRSTISYVVEEIGIIYCYPFTFKINLEYTSWGDISTISELGLAPQFFALGEKKSIYIGAYRSYDAQIIGFAHDNLTSGGKAGITFQIVKCDGSGTMEATSTNRNGWGGCARRTSLQDSTYNELRSDLKNVIKTVKKLTSAGNKSTSIKTSNDTLFLLSEIEVLGSITNSVAGEGTQYAYYAAGNTSVKEYDGSRYEWWLRSPYKNYDTAFCSIGTAGDPAWAGASKSHGLAFAFCV